MAVIKELAKQAEHHVTHDACFLEAYMPDVTPLVTTNNGEFYTQNAMLTLPVFSNTFINSLACGPSGSGPTCQLLRTRTTGKLRPYV